MPFEIPEGWVWCKLEDIAQSNIGLTYKPTDITEEGIPVYRSNNIQDRKIDKSDIVRVNAQILEKQFLNIGDLLICARNGSRRLVGKCAIIEEIDEATSFGAFMAVCRSKYNQWIFTLLNTTYFDRYLDDSNSTAINQVTQSMLLAFQIPLPPLAEQNRITAEIERWFALIDQIEQGKADLQTTIKQAKNKILDLAIHGKLVPQAPNDEPAIELLKRINPDFTPCDNVHYTFKIPNSWTWCKLGDIAQSNIGLTYKPTDITGNGIPVYRSNNIRDRKIDKSDLVRVNAPILEKQFLNIGDLLICARNGSRRLVGKCAIIEELDEATSFGAFMAVCRSEYNQWIFNLLNTTYFDRYLDDSNSTAINQVTQRMLLALHIPLPPLSEQQRIVQKIEELFSVLDNIQNALEV